MKVAEICSKDYTLIFDKNKQNEIGYSVYYNGSSTPAYQTRHPCYLMIKSLSAAVMYYETAYAEVCVQDHITIASGMMTSEAGTVFQFEDRFFLREDQGIQIDRKVRVKRSQKEDTGFSTRISFGMQESQKLNEYDCFAPGVWYRQNDFVPDEFFGHDFDEDYYWIFETRCALPVFSAMNRQTGHTISLSRARADVSMRKEVGPICNHLVDENLTFASVGLNLKAGLSIDYVFPAAEGTKLEARRNEGSAFPFISDFEWTHHPVRENFEQRYSVVLRIGHDTDFSSMMQRVWRSTYQQFDPPVLEMDNQRVYETGMKLLDQLCQEYDGVWGIPFRCLLPDGENSYVAYQFGFVGQQPNIAYQLMRYGTEYHRPETIEKGIRMIQFWVKNSLTPLGAPKIWYCPKLHDFEKHPLWLRMIGDGLEGVLEAYQYMKKQGRDYPTWLAFCVEAADWLLRIQQEDGSWCRSYHDNGDIWMESKANTTNVIRFLLRLYQETENISFKNAALRAGEWAYQNVYLNMEYRGGTCDNADVYDKESGIYALIAFLSLYDAIKEKKWLSAAAAAADYVETWTFAWSYPVKTPYQKHAFNKVNILGQSLIATGHSAADMYMAACSFLYYRLYLITGDVHYLDFARFIHKNTKQTTDLDGKFGYRIPGMCEESGRFFTQFHDGVYSWLPWCTYVEIEPISRLWDNFGVYEIDEAEEHRRTYERKKSKDTF